MRRTAILTTVITVPFLIVGCATSQTATTYDVARLGDNSLSCDELLAEINTLQANRGQAATDADKASTTALGVETAGTAALLLAPVTAGLSLLATAGAATFATSAGEKTISASQMNERAQHLIKLFNNKDCKVKTASAAGKTKKGSLGPEQKTK